MLGAGDVLLHSPFWAQAAGVAHSRGESGYDFDPLFDAVRADVSAADLAICHMETPLGTPGGPFSSYPIFNVPPQVTKAIKGAGFDRCSTASNHTIDKGYAGVQRTLDALDAAGLGHSGSARTAAEAAQLSLFAVNGVTVGHLSYTFSFNGLRLPADKPWLANLISGDRILADAHALKQAGASVVIVSLHWGTEYAHAANGDQIALAHRLLDSPDVDLILGCHAHVVQSFEQINGKWVVYGMGNEVAWQTQQQDTRDGVMPRVHLHRGAARRVPGDEGAGDPDVHAAQWGLRQAGRGTPRARLGQPVRRAAQPVPGVPGPDPQGAAGPRCRRRRPGDLRQLAA